MSTYYDFYAAVKKNDKVEAIGPHIRKEGEYRLVPIVSRSRSFIHFDEFDYWDLPIEKMIDDQIQFFTCEGWTGEERRSIACYIPYEDIRAMADDGLVQGYVTLDELNAVAANNYSQDSLWDVWVKTPEMIAEMDSETRKEYGHIAYIDHCNTGYICSQLINAVDPYEYGYDTKDLCFIVRVPKLGQHALRHTFATRCIESGIPAVVLKTWLGHKNIHVTLDTYTDIFKAMDNGTLEKFDAYIDAM